MKLVIHDFAGHPFQTLLSSELAKRGHEVFHVYFKGDQGPKGKMIDEFYLKGSLRYIGINISKEYSKTNFIKRFFQDIQYSIKLENYLKDLHPDLVISANTPTWVQSRVIKICIKNKTKFVYWCQDFYSIAVTKLLTKKFFLLGKLIGEFIQRIEKKHFLSSDHIIHITEKFGEITDEWGINKDKVSIIHNWGALNEINVLQKKTNWLESNNLDPSIGRVLYSGTLALKHNPDLLIEVAKKLTDLEVVVIGSGIGIDKLKLIEDKYPNLKILPLQPFKDFEEVLASSDVLLGVIEEDAGEFSVPSKVLNYLCSGRPIVLAAPKENLSSKIIQQTKSGYVVAPQDKKGFVRSISKLMKNENERNEMGNNARLYAEERFDIRNVTDSFEDIFIKVLKRSY